MLSIVLEPWGKRYLGDSHPKARLSFRTGCQKTDNQVVHQFVRRVNELNHFLVSDRRFSSYEQNPLHLRPVELMELHFNFLFALPFSVQLHSKSAHFGNKLVAIST